MKRLTLALVLVLALSACKPDLGKPKDKHLEKGPYISKVAPVGGVKDNVK
jgi:hypothetical protein